MTGHALAHPPEKRQSANTSYFARSVTPRGMTGQAVIGALLALDGVGVLALWILSLTSGAFGGISGLFVYQEGNYPVFHVSAELLMGMLAVASGGGLVGRRVWARGLALVAFGMLGYSAINSAGWPIRNDLTLLVPMVATLALVLISIPVIVRDLARGRSDS